MLIVTKEMKNNIYKIKLYNGSTVELTEGEEITILGRGEDVEFYHEGESYTVQFYIDVEGKYHLEEVRARFNKAISEEHLQYLKDKLKDI